MRNLYKFYKMSSKRKLGLKAACAQKKKRMNDLIETMTTEMNAEKEDLKARSNLRLKK